MIDMFSIDKTTPEQLEILRTEIKEYQDKNILENKKAKIKLFLGNLDNVNNGILVISDSPKSRFFESHQDDFLVNLLSSFGIHNYFITYNYLIGGPYGSKEIKNFSFYIKKLKDILNPKLIVCMGEQSQFCFFKRKFMMLDFHGKEIGDYESTPIYTTYPVWYYEENSKFEDDSYKKEIKTKDWTAIKLKYQELICC